MITITDHQLARLSTPKPCGITTLAQDSLIFCGHLAIWSIDDVPVCSHDIAIIAGMNGDNEEFLKPALREVAA